MFAPRRTRLIAAGAAAAMALSASYAAAGTPSSHAAGTTPSNGRSGASGNHAELKLLERPTDRFRHAIISWRRAHPAADGGSSQEGGFAPPESFGVSTSTLDAIAACESGGDPTAVSPDGTYRGKYQFDYGTWASMGGSGDPAAAPEAEQDMRAAMLYAQAGSSPWPICGV